jgi:hypothetical protein
MNWTRNNDRIIFARGSLLNRLLKLRPRLEKKGSSAFSGELAIFEGMCGQKARAYPIYRNFPGKNGRALNKKMAGGETTRHLFI